MPLLGKLGVNNLTLCFGRQFQILLKATHPLLFPNLANQLLNLKEHLPLFHKTNIPRGILVPRDRLVLRVKRVSALPRNPRGGSEVPNCQEKDTKI